MAEEALPGLAPGLHLIGEGDVVGPDVKLPLPEPQHAAVHPAAVDAHAHVHIHAGHLSYQSAKKEKKEEEKKKTTGAAKIINFFKHFLLNALTPSRATTFNRFEYEDLGFTSHKLLLLAQL